MATPAQDTLPAPVLVTGGSGFLGINLIRWLLAHGAGEVRSLDLVAFDYPEKDDPRVRTVVGDVRDREAVRALMAGCRAVVHCAAALPLCSEEEIRSTDVDGARIVAEEAKAAGVARFVYISSTAVYGIPDHHPVREGDRLIGVGPYGESKIVAEGIARGLDAPGFAVSILRPKSFVGPERLGVFALLYDWAYTGHGFPMIGSGRNRYQLLDVEDLCDAIGLCLTHSDASAVRDTYNVGADRFATMREDWQAVLDAAGHGKCVRGTPAWLVIPALRVLEALHLSPLYRWVYETAPCDSFVDVSKIRDRLGWSPRFSNRDALLRNYAWYVANLPRFQGQSGKTHRVPWKQGILSLIKRCF
ncbi:MAG TPA: NAD-dependent epimerase/dehydratase family protein [Candidatus Spyradenecus faecavium]|uniref:NAD-dependent epimerase/dehydratase family protein n=1 Tax=Candidatus Spyradenecus faecavium TaxID=2840947 RepID=A0A9D1NPI2_9BACT|nr:NAD-dependent epimerase/dehydratase family protein [Candidatus Spyradenecus faecavium]